VPSTIGVEKATNPFLRPASAELRATLKLPDAADADVLGETRRCKDRF
jgi:hydroxyacylglutathione hydrolase